MIAVAFDIAAEAAVARARPSGDPDFRVLLGEAAWLSLPEAVRRRFGPAMHAGAVVYPGEMEVRASWLGLAFAHLCRLIGTPLAPWRGRSVPVRVVVRQHVKGGQIWDRTYDFPDHQGVKVSSRKVVSGDGVLMELVRGGLGMTLAVSAEEGALVFRSRGYFLALSALRLPIPLLVTPGQATVRHQDQGGGWFRFTLRFVHPWAGETIYQTGLFLDPEGGT